MNTRVSGWLLLLFPLFLPGLARAQGVAWTDTLQAAVKTDTRSIVRSINKLESGADALLLNAPVAANSGFGFDEVRYVLIRAAVPAGENAPQTEIPEMKMGSKIDLAQEIVDFTLDKLKNA